MISSSNYQSYYMGYFCRPVSAKQNCRKSYSNIHQNETKILSQEFQMKNKTVFQINNQEADDQVKAKSQLSARYQNYQSFNIDGLRSSNNFQPYNKSHRQSKGSYKFNSNQHIKRPRSSVQRSFNHMQNQTVNKVLITAQNSHIRLNSENLVANRHKTNQQRKKLHQNYATRKNSHKNRTFFRNINSAKQHNNSVQRNFSQRIQSSKFEQVKAKFTQVQKLNLLLNRNAQDIVRPDVSNKNIKTAPKYGQAESQIQIQNIQPIFSHFPETYNITQQVFSKKSNPRVYHYSKQLSEKQNTHRSNRGDDKNMLYSYSMVVQQYIKPKIIKIIENQQHREQLAQSLMERVLALTTKKTPIHNRPYKDQNQVKFTKNNRPKRGLSIGVYKNVQKVTFQRKVIQKDVNMIITSARNMKPKEKNLIDNFSMDQSQLLNLFKEKRKNLYVKPKSSKSKKKIVYQKKIELSQSVQQIDPKPW